MPQSARIGPLSLDGAVVGTVTIIDDVSDRLASEIALRQQIEAQQPAPRAAEQALRAKDEFLSTLSHEIRTPLNAVLGWARILLDRQTLDRSLLDRGAARDRAQRLGQARMIDDMLDMARIASGKLRLDMQPVDFVKVVLAAVDVIMPSAHARLTAPDEPRLADAERARRSGSPAAGDLEPAVERAEVHRGGRDDRRATRANGRFVRIAVTDTGQGINPDFLPHVFERFRQADASSSRRHGGLGVGLALVHDLIELHGGSVHAHSEGEGKGSNVYDRSSDGAGPCRSGSATESFDGIARSRAQVLLIDDETDRATCRGPCCNSAGPW